MCVCFFKYLLKRIVTARPMGNQATFKLNQLAASERLIINTKLI